MGQNFKTAVDKDEVKCNAKLRSNYFPVNVSVPAIVFHQQILETSTETFTQK